MKILNDTIIEKRKIEEKINAAKSEYKDLSTANLKKRKELYAAR